MRGISFVWPDGIGRIKCAWKVWCGSNRKGMDVGMVKWIKQGILIFWTCEKE